MIDTTLVYSYRHMPYDGVEESKKESFVPLMLKWYKLSMSVGRKLGYKIAIYCDNSIKDFFEEYADEVNYVESYFDSYWDSYKFIALENRSDNFILLDQDVILKKPIDEFNVKVVVDQMGRDRYKLYHYGDDTIKTPKFLQKYESLGVKEIFPEFNYKDNPLIPTTGVLKFNCDKSRQDYLDVWKKLYKFTETNKINSTFATSIAAEFSLGCLIYNRQWSYKSLSIKDGLDFYSIYHTHYSGNKKFKPGIVNFDIKVKSLF